MCFEWHHWLLVKMTAGCWLHNLCWDVPRYIPQVKDHWIVCSLTSPVATQPVPEAAGLCTWLYPLAFSIPTCILSLILFLFSFGISLASPSFGFQTRAPLISMIQIQIALYFFLLPCPPYTLIFFLLAFQRQVIRIIRLIRHLHRVFFRLLT